MKYWENFVKMTGDVWSAVVKLTLIWVIACAILPLWNLFADHSQKAFQRLPHAVAGNMEKTINYVRRL